MTLPPTVPVLKPEMTSRGPSAEPCGCLGQWISRIFPDFGIGLKALGFNNYFRLFRWNDAHAADERADLWNNSIPKLGYVRDPSGSHFHLQGREGM